MTCCPASASAPPDNGSRSIAGMARPENAGFLGRSGPCPRNASDKRQAPRQIQNAVQQHNLLIVPTLQRGSAILTLQRHQTGSTPRREAFFSLPAQRKEPVVWSAPHHCERAALPLRRPRSTGCGTGGAKTRCAQTVCPFFPVPHPAARLSAKGLFSSPETHPAPNHPPGGASVSPRGGGVCGGSSPRWSVGTIVFLALGF